MISIRKYLDGARDGITAETQTPPPAAKTGDLLALCFQAYRTTLVSVGRASVEACPALGTSLERALASISETLSASPSLGRVTAANVNVQTEVENWGRSTARHYLQKAAEVKEILLVMARTAESVGDRDQRCAKQLNDVTANLNSIASLEDISQIRISIEKSASDLKGSVDRMTAEGKAVLDQLKAQVTIFEARLAEAEHIASCDALTQLRSRLWMETQIERYVIAVKPFCVALVDLDGFKRVNDKYGHQAGDEVLQQFAAELKSACRSTDLVGRWGGDEFLVLLDGSTNQAQAQMDRVRKWVCGSYTISRESGRLKIPVIASIGLAEFVAGETMKQLLDRADAAMYANKNSACVVEGLSRA